MGLNQRLVFCRPPVSWTTISEYKAYESIFECPGYALVQHYKVHYGCFSAIFRLGLFLFNFPFFCSFVGQYSFSFMYTKFILMYWQTQSPHSMCGHEHETRPRADHICRILDLKSLYNFDNVSYKHWLLTFQCTFEGEQSDTLFDACVPLNYPL